MNGFGQLRSEFYYFSDPTGAPAGFSGVSRKDSQLARFKYIGVLSHLRAQAAGLVRWVAKGGSWAILSRQFDDSNVWVSPERSESRLEQSVDSDGAGADEPDSEDEAQAASSAGRQGRRRVAQILGMLQTLSIRRAASIAEGGELDSTRIYVPSQVLPKATGPF